MKISEEILKELRHLIPELGRALDSHINVQLNLTYYSHSNRYEESAELWIADKGILVDFSDDQSLVNSIKAEIACCKGGKPDA